MDEKKSWFFYSQRHRNHLVSIAAGSFRKTWCKLDDGRVLEYTAATEVGKKYVNDNFTDYIFLGEGVTHQK